MQPAQSEEGLATRRPFVILIGGNASQRASIYYAGKSELMYVEPVSGAGELGLRDLTRADVLLAWNEHDIIEELKCHLAIAAHWCPIVAVSENPSVAQVVRAMKAGAIDYVDWRGDFAEVREAVAVAYELKCKLLPQKERQMEVRRRLRELTPRELEVLTAMSADFHRTRN